MDTFKEEFTKLLECYKSPKIQDEILDKSIPLSNEQILDAVQDVLRCSLSLNLKMTDTATFKTPISEIIVSTPDAPDVSKIDYNQNNTLLKSRYRSLELINTERLSPDKKTRQSLSPDRTVKAVNLNEKERTMVLDDCLQKKTNTEKIQIYDFVEEAHMNTVKATNEIENLRNKLDDIRKLLIPEIGPIRRLSTIMSQPTKTKMQEKQQQTTDASSTLRTIQRSKALRRSVHQLNDDMSATPTSRLSLPSMGTPQYQASVKKPSAGSLISKPVIRPTPDQSNRSVSTSMQKKSQVSSGNTPATSSKVSKDEKSTRLSLTNSKYAHVQSSIPKCTSSTVKRKV